MTPEGILQANTEQIERGLDGTRALPWESAPYRLVRWCDLEKFAAEVYCRISGNLGALSFEFSAESMSHPTSPKRVENLAWQLEGIVPSCRAIGLKTSALQLEDAVTRLREPNVWTGPILGQTIRCLNVAINSEMSTHLFMRIFPERIDFYEQANLFGDAVGDHFPGASKDIQQAGSCYAADRNTACVMHLMRVLELGLNALARKLQVRFERREWENVINEIEAEIKKINGPHAGADWREQQRFYGEAAKDFRYFKNAWRNHAMHAREHYEASEARTILDHVKSFMVHLAEGGLKE